MGSDGMLTSSSCGNIPLTQLVIRLDEHGVTDNPFKSELNHSLFY